MVYMYMIFDYSVFYQRHDDSYPIKDKTIHYVLTCLSQVVLFAHISNGLFILL